MKAFLFLSLTFILLAFASEGFGKPRIIKGTVYTKDGKKAKGVIVTADKSRDKYYTSFDGSYEIKAKTSSKWLKYRFEDQEQKFYIHEIKRDVIDFTEDTTMEAIEKEKIK